MSSTKSSETCHGSNLGISAIVDGQVLSAVGDTRAVIEKDRDVDAHDGDDAATVKIHHEEVLEIERTNLIVHNLNQTESKHQKDQDLAVHGGQCDP